MFHAHAHTDAHKTVKESDIERERLIHDRDLHSGWQSLTALKAAMTH